MNYCLLLAGGNGTRMGNTGVPKQFLELKNKPIIIWSLENLIKCSAIDKVIIVCNKPFIPLLAELLKKYNLQDFAEVTAGGKNRLMSAVSGIKYIERTYGINDKDIVLAHDSVRMFTDTRIFNENIENAKKYGAATTVFYLEETILETGDDGLLFKAHPREKRFSGQSPQTFNIKEFMECFDKLADEQKDTFTDLAEVLYVNGEKVYPVIGSKGNLKITTPIDMVIAELRIDGKGYGFN